MKNNEYNSLTEKLIQSGIIQTDNSAQNSPDINFFNAKNVDINENIQMPDEKEESINRKRINNYDLELLENADVSLEQQEENHLQRLLYKFFPKLYEFKIAKDAIQKMSELGINSDILLDKAVPYGENELRYKNLVKFIKYANEIQTKLKRKSKAK